MKTIDQTKEQITWLDGCDPSNPITKQELEGNGQPLARIYKLRSQLEEQIRAIESADYYAKFGKFKWQRYSLHGPDNQALQNALSQIVLGKFSRPELPVECEFSSLRYDQMLAIGKPGESRKYKFAIMKTPCFQPQLAR